MHISIKTQRITRPVKEDTSRVVSIGFTEETDLKLMQARFLLTKKKRKITVPVIKLKTNFPTSINISCVYKL